MFDLLQKRDSASAPPTDLPYAELWMGSHVNCPSLLEKGGEKVSLREHLGEAQALPFLFKVLSVDKVLSI